MKELSKKVFQFFLSMQVALSGSSISSPDFFVFCEHIICSRQERISHGHSVKLENKCLIH